MQKLANNTNNVKGSICSLCILGLFFFSACLSSTQKEDVDRLNEKSYAFHYRDLDSAMTFAKQAFALAPNYKSGRAEAYNNMAFVCIARMEYDKAFSFLDSLSSLTDNQIELLVADVQYMRLCQRMSKNKDFYDYRERAISRIKRIEEEGNSLTGHLKSRFAYALSEFFIVSSTYYYYVGLNSQSRNAVFSIQDLDELQTDTAQYVSYLYQLGSGGILSGKTKAEISQDEFDCLLKGYSLSQQAGLVYWQANMLQSVSEHLLDKTVRRQLLASNKLGFQYLNNDNMPDSLLAGNLAQRALDLFSVYGDAYQKAGAYRTLSLCYWYIGDYSSALICLDNALADKKILQAPDLIASIREQLSLVYSAVDDKSSSDLNRNYYLDIQETTRQDRKLEARAGQLERMSAQQDMLITAILVLTLITVLLLFLFKYLRKRKGNNGKSECLEATFNEWSEAERANIERLEDNLEDIREQVALAKLDIEKNKRRCVDNKTKVFLVGNVVPYIDRIICEIGKLKNPKEVNQTKEERLTYISELIDEINKYNNVLTNWIRIQQGEVKLHIESFDLKELFDMLAESKTSFKLKGIELNVKSEHSVVKADKVLTMFMVNTLADNAYKFTPSGGKVNVSASSTEEYVEVSVSDTGKGISKEELPSIFGRKLQSGHGFGLMNCKGIIERYHKVSPIFTVCDISVESVEGRGSRFFFRLPHGLLRTSLLLLCAFFATFSSLKGEEGEDFHYARNTEQDAKEMQKAGAFADSVYYCNVKGDYIRALALADSVRSYMNAHYKRMFPNGRFLMVMKSNDGEVPAEIRWFRDKVSTDYGVILDMRNEVAVAALALHKWDLYSYNNKVYTQLFKEKSADKSLADYCIMMQKSGTNKAIAAIVLVMLLISILLAYYFFYYRHVLHFNSCVRRIDEINKFMTSDASNEDKFDHVKEVDYSTFPLSLKVIVEEIINGFSALMEREDEVSRAIDEAKEELGRIRYERDRLYVCNNVIDNCLSSLKHETMYYPARIKNLLESQCEDINVISEVVAYYEKLYTMLFEQVQRQADSISFDCRKIDLKEKFGIEGSVLCDKVLFAYLFDLIKGLCHGDKPEISASLSNDKYVVFNVICRNIRYSLERCHSIFTPQEDNIPFLVCRQIVRESCGQTSRYGCGIYIEPFVEGGVLIRISLSRA